MTIRTISVRFRLILRRWRADERGVGLVEFAMTLPILVLIYTGLFALTQGFMVDRKVTLVSRAIGDIVTQTSRGVAIKQGETDTFFTLAAAIMQPYPNPPTTLRMRVSSVRIRLNGDACVQWSVVPTNSASNWKSWTNASTINSLVPASLRAATGFSYIVSEAEYTYKPLIGADITGTLNLTQSFTLTPRNDSSVQYTGTTAACAN